MSEGSSRTMGFVALFLIALISIGVAWIARERSLRAHTETQLIAQLEQIQGAPSVTIGEHDFPRTLFNDSLDATLKRVARNIQSPIRACTEGEGEVPVQITVRIATDPAGRMRTFAARGVSEELESCLAHVLSMGQYLRRVDGIALLPLSYDRAD